MCNAHMLNLSNGNVINMLMLDIFSTSEYFKNNIYQYPRKFNTVFVTFLMFVFLTTFPSHSLLLLNFACLFCLPLLLYLLSILTVTCLLLCIVVLFVLLHIQFFSPSNLIDFHAFSMSCFFIVCLNLKIHPFILYPFFNTAILISCMNAIELFMAGNIIGDVNINYNMQLYMVKFA